MLSPRKVASDPNTLRGEGTIVSAAKASKPQGLVSNLSAALTCLWLWTRGFGLPTLSGYEAKGLPRGGHPS